MRLLPFVALTLVACAPSLRIGAACELNSECPLPLVCRNDRCRVECVDARDCAFGLRCVASGVCTLPEEEACTTDCPRGLVCAEGQCRTGCDAVRPCTASGQCVAGTCVEPRNGDDAGVISLDATFDASLDAGSDVPALDTSSDAPFNPPSCLTCGDGRTEACSAGLPEIAAIVGGGSLGDATVMATHTLESRVSPLEFGAPLSPEVSVGLSPAGFGVVAMIAEGTTREVVFHRFDLDDLTTAAPFTVDRPDFSMPALTNARTVTLREHGEQVMGFVLLTEPATSGSTSGHQVIFDVDGSSERPIGAGDPPATTAPHLTIVGGDRSVLGTSAPLYFIGREIALGGPVLGAIDAVLSMATYRATRTDPLLEPVLDTSGSAGSVVLARDTGTSVALWNVERTVPGTRVNDLVLQDVGALGAPAIELVSAADFEYLVAVPVDAVGRGATRLFRAFCPSTAPCGSLTARGDVPSREGSAPRAVRLAALPGGYALATIERRASGGDAVYLRILDRDLAVSTELLDPLVTPIDALEDVVAIDVAAVSDGSLVTVVVAALVRRSAGTRDRVVLAGLQACITR